MSRKQPRVKLWLRIGLGSVLAVLLAALVGAGTALAGPLFEAGTFDLPDTTSTPVFQSVIFRQTYDAAPLVFVVATNEGADPSSLRVQNVTRTGFEVIHVEPGDKDGAHAVMTNLAYFAITPGRWEIAPGVFIEAATIDTATTIAKSGGTWDTVSLQTPFASAPAVQVFTQTMNSESNPVPSGPSVPWITNAVRNVGAGSFQTALDRAEADGDGGTVVAETLGYVALTQIAGTLDGFMGKYTIDGSGSLLLDSLISADNLTGWTDQDPDGDGIDVPFNQTFSSAPLVVASLAKRDGADGGWLRTGDINASRVKLTVDEDTFSDSDRGHTTEAASVFAFERAFHAFTTSGVDVGWDNDSADGLWATNRNWRVNNDPLTQDQLPNDVLPTSTDTANIASLGGTATVQTGDDFELAGLRVGVDATAALGISGNGVLNVDGGALTVHGTLEMGRDGNAGTLNINGGTVTVEGDIVVDSALATGTGTIDLNPGGTLRLYGTAGTREVTDFSHDGGGTLLLTIATFPANLTPLNVTGTATFENPGALVDVEVDPDGVGNTADDSKSVSWVGNGGSWDVKANWQTPTGENLLPEGAATVIVAPGDSFTFLEAPSAGDIIGGANAVGGSGWTVAQDANQMKVVSTDDYGVGAVRAIIDKATADVTRDSDLRIAPEDGVDATQLDVANGALTLTGGSSLILGGSADGRVDQDGGTVTITGDLRFGPADNTEGGVYNLNAGTLHVLGDIIETNGGVDSAQMHVNGGTLNVTGDITTQRFALGQAGGSTGTYALPAGKKLTTTGTMSVGANGTGELTIEGGTSVVSNSNVYVGEAGSGQGTVTIDGGTWIVNQFLRIGNSGTGTVTLNDGTLDVRGTSGSVRGLRLAENSSGRGELNIGRSDGSTSPTVTVAGGNLETADAGIGTVTMYSGSLTLNSNNLIIGQAGSSDATFNMMGGTVDLRPAIGGGADSGMLRVPNSGTGKFNMEGGELWTGRDFELTSGGGSSGGTADISGGTLHVGRNLNFRSDTSSGDDVVHVSGTALVEMTGGGSINFANASDRLNLSGGTIQMNGGDIMATEQSGQFVFTGGRLENLGRFLGPPKTPDRSGTGTPQDGVLSSADVGQMSYGNLVAGKLGGAIDFDGNNDYVDFGTNDVLAGGPDAFSVSLWFDRNVNDTGGSNDTNHNVNNVLVAQSRTQGNDNFEVGSEDADIEGYVDMNAGSDFTGKVSFANGVQDNTWHHLVVTFDASRTTDEVHYWLDGQQATKDIGNGARLATSPAELTLGIARIDNERWGDFEGQIDEFSLWGRVLGDAEIARLYNTGDGATLQSLIDDASDPLDTTSLDIYAPMDELEPAMDVTLVQSGGTLAPGDPIGTTAVLGDYELLGGMLEIEINGFDQGDAGAGGDPAGDGVGYDFVDLTGAATLDSLLDVQLLDGFVPQVGDTFDVLTAAEGVSLEAGFDLVQPSGMLAATYFRADVLDLGGAAQALRLSVAVPEPGTMVLLAVGVLGVILWRRRRRGGIGCS